MAFDTNSWLGDVILGGALVAVGAMLTSLGWHFIGKYKKKTILRYIINTILIILIVGGPIIIGIGGTLTTLGWNKKDNDQQKKALIRAVAQEWSLNQRHLKTSNLFTGELYDDTGKVWKYPLFRKSALNRLIISGLFSSDNRKDEKLLRAVILYEIMIEEINNFFTTVNTVVTRDKNSAEEVYHLVIDSHWYKKFKKYHEEIEDVLVNNYGWAMSNPKQ